MGERVHAAHLPPQNPGNLGKCRVLFDENFVSSWTAGD